jgi:cobalt-zinc-cadmium efflux system protein
MAAASAPHSHHHHHHHAGGGYDAAFAWGAALNFVYVIVEGSYGFITHSMALLADAGHNLGDVAALLVAWGATALVRRRPTARFTYGLRSSSILAALLNAVLLLVAVGAIALECVRRLMEPEPVASGTVLVVALVGIAVNGTTTLFFQRGRESDLNVRSAFLHMLADTLVSAGVVVAAIVIMLLGWTWVDPAIGLAIVAVIIVGTWDLLRHSIQMALHAVPSAIDPVQVRDYLLGLDGVADLHDLHIWPISTTETALTCHLVMPGMHCWHRPPTSCSIGSASRTRRCR